MPHSLFSLLNIFKTVCVLVIEDFLNFDGNSFRILTFNIMFAFYMSNKYPLRCSRSCPFAYTV